MTSIAPLSASAATPQASFVPDTPKASGAPTITLLPDNGTNAVAAASREGPFIESLKGYMKKLGGIDNGLDASQEAHPLEKSDAPSIAKTASEYIAGVNDQVVKSDADTRDYLTGKNKDAGAVAASVEEADLALDFTLALARRLTTTMQTLQSIQM